MTSEENWYLSKIIYCIDLNFGSNTKQLDEQLRIIKANNITEAFVKAKLLGVKNEFIINNTNANHVKWNFVDITDINQIEAITDGMEICSKIEEHNDIENYLHFVKARAKALEHKYLPQPVSNT